MKRLTGLSQFLLFMLAMTLFTFGVKTSAEWFVRRTQQVCQQRATAYAQEHPDFTGVIICLPNTPVTHYR